MTFAPIVQIFIPLYGSGVRFRCYLRLREFFRKHELWFFATCLKSLLQYKYGCEISIHAQISVKAQFMHTVGVVIGEGSIIEEGVIIYSGVVLGRKDISKPYYPIVRKNAILCTNCSLLGGITIGENSIIGAHSLVIDDCESNSTYVGSPALKIKTNRNK